MVDAWRLALADADLTVGAVEELLGEQAQAALRRNQTTSAWRRSQVAGPLATLVRLWLLQRPVSRTDAEAALPGLVEPLVAADLLETGGGEVRALVVVRPYGDQGNDWWVVSDLTPGLDGAERRMNTDHVLGVSGASMSLAQMSVRTPVGRALDLGTGSGVQSLHLAQQAGSVVATDVNPRCLAMADLTARLNAIDVDVRAGSLWAPVQGEVFDLIVTNPPFVISPGTGERLVYRDSGLPGDDLVRHVVEGAGRHLTQDGVCQVLANWVHREDEPWVERVGGWVADSGCDAWIVERDLADPSRYVELWLDDAGLRGAPDYTARYDAWLSWFERERIAAVGFGWVALHKTSRAAPYVQIENWRYDVEQPLGPSVARWIAIVDLVQTMDDEQLLAARLTAAPDVVEERVGRPGAADPEQIMIRSQRGMRRAHRTGTAVAAMVGACDGDLSLGQIVGALAELLETPQDGLSAELCTAARRMLLDGLLEPPH